MDYSGFTSKDFILDDFFKGWVLTSDPKIDEFWKNWLKEHPEKLAEIESARKFILQLSFKTHYPTYEEYLQDWNKLSQEIDDFEISTTSSDEHIIRIIPVSDFQEQENTFKYWRGIAASVAVLFIIGLGYLFYLNRDIDVYTKFGETKRIVLPDQTIVTLNANSRLTYNSGLTKNEIREVWVEGEAFFNVKKRISRQKFIVHTKYLNVEVLGTQFNVSDRKNTTRVVLNEGKVRLDIKESPENSSIVMIPGDLVEFHKDEKKLHKERVNSEMYSSWKENLLIFDNTPLQEVADVLENTYGYKVEFSDTSLRRRKLVGTFAADSVDELLWNLKKIYSAKVSSDKKYIEF